MCGEKKVEECLTIFLVEARLKLVGRWRSADKMAGVRNVLKASELNNSMKEMAYQESVCGKYEMCRRGECVGVGKVQRYSNGVYRCMCHETHRRTEKKGA